MAIVHLPHYSYGMEAMPLIEEARKVLPEFLADLRRENKLDEEKAAQQAEEEAATLKAKEKEREEFSEFVELAKLATMTELVDRLE